MFDREGNDIAPRAKISRQAQSFYIDQLLQLADEDQRRPLGNQPPLPIVDVADIVWQHSNGQVHYWPMENGQRQGSIDISIPVRRRMAPARRRRCRR